MRASTAAAVVAAVIAAAAVASTNRFIGKSGLRIKKHHG
jgi:hypothetical protein